MTELQSGLPFLDCRRQHLRFRLRPMRPRQSRLPSWFATSSSARVPLYPSQYARDAQPMPTARFGYCRCGCRRCGLCDGSATKGRFDLGEKGREQTGLGLVGERIGKGRQGVYRRRLASDRCRPRQSQARPIHRGLHFQDMQPILDKEHGRDPLPRSSYWRKSFGNAAKKRMS